MSIFAPVFRAILPLEGPLPLTAARIVDWLGGGDTLSGARVNLETVRGLPAAYACNRVLAEGVASLPLHVFERLEPRGRRAAREHPVFRLLAEEPHPGMTSFKLRATLQGHLGFRGNGFCEIERDRSGQPVALWPLRPDRMDRPHLSQAGRLIYPYLLPNGEKIALPQHLVLHLRGLSDDGLWGYAPLTVFRESFGRAIAMREHGSRYFSQGAEPGGVLQTKARLGDEAADRLDRSWKMAHEGLKNRWRIAILEEGVEWKQTGMSNEDSQFIESEALSVLDMCRIFRIQPHKVAELTRATFSNIEQQSIEHVTDTLLPWLVNWEQQLAQALFLPAERARYYPKHIVAGLLRGDSAARVAFYGAGILGGWLSPDDVRELEEMNPLPDGLGEVYFRPLNMTAVSTEPLSAS